MKNNKGVTLVELIIAMGLMGIVMSIAFSMVNFSSIVQKKSVEEYSIQADTRLAVQYVNNISRTATAVFTIPESSFRENNLTNGWDYIGMLDGDIVLFRYVNEATGHQKTVIADGGELIDYRIRFTQPIFPEDEDHSENLIKYIISGFIKDKPIEYDAFGQPIADLVIESQVEAVNSLQIIQKGSAIDPAVALAFRDESRTDIVVNTELPVANVTLVLDRSGSMNNNMNGYSTGTIEEKRIYFLKNSATKLITNFAASDYPVNVALIPFATSANNPGTFYRAQDDQALLTSNIANITTGGGTNTGDGLRRGYYRLLGERSVYTGRELTEYIIILVDGVTTYGTASGYRSNPNFELSDGNISENYDVKGYGYKLDPEYGEGYNAAMGQMVKDDGQIKVFVIGFSNNSTDFGSLNQLGISCDAEKNPNTGLYYFTAGSETELDIIFGEIHREILSDLWFIDGPQL